MLLFGGSQFALDRAVSCDGSKQSFISIFSKVAILRWARIWLAALVLCIADNEQIPISEELLVVNLLTVFIDEYQVKC